MGVALMSGMYGLIGGISCKSMRCEQTVRNAVLYAIVLQILTLSFCQHVAFPAKRFSAGHSIFGFFGSRAPRQAEAYRSGKNI